MTDFYTQRLNKEREAKQARSLNSLPLQKPNSMNPVGTEASDVTTLAGKPRDPSAGPELEAGPFSERFQHYSKDDRFKVGMSEFATAMQALRNELQGVNLPPEVMEGKVRSVLDKFKNRTMNNLQQEQMAAQQQEGAAIPEQIIGGAGNGY